VPFRPPTIFAKRIHPEEKRMKRLTLLAVLAGIVLSLSPRLRRKTL
jgi:hypothetical protein